MRVQSWDIAAGMLLVREAGGKVTSYEGLEQNDAILMSGRITASNSSIHDEMLAALAESYS